MTNYYPNSCYIPQICQNNLDELNKWTNKFTPKMLLIGEIFSSARQGTLPFVPVSVGMPPQEVINRMGRRPSLATPAHNNPGYRYYISSVTPVDFIFQGLHLSKIIVQFEYPRTKYYSFEPSDTLIRSISLEDIVSYNPPDITGPGSSMTWLLNDYQLVMRFAKHDMGIRPELRSIAVSRSSVD